MARLGEDGSGKQEALKDVFRVNHEIGRISRSFTHLAPALREVQLQVNFTTIQIKRNRPEAALEGFARVSSSLSRLTTSPPSGPT